MGWLRSPPSTKSEAASVGGLFSTPPTRCSSPPFRAKTISLCGLRHTLGARINLRLSCRPARHSRNLAPVANGGPLLRWLVFEPRRFGDGPRKELRTASNSGYLLPHAKETSSHPQGNNLRHRAQPRARLPRLQISDRRQDYRGEDGNSVCGHSHDAGAGRDQPQAQATGRAVQ